MIKLISLTIYDADGSEMPVSVNPDNILFYHRDRSESEAKTEVIFSGCSLRVKEAQKDLDRRLR